MRTAPAVSRRALLGGFALTTALASLGLAGCGGSPDADYSAAGNPLEGLLRADGLAGRDAREIIDSLEALPLDERSHSMQATVLPDRLALSDDSGRSAALSLPAGHSYTAVAPFVQTTHDCFHHELSHCTGELLSVEVEVLLTADNGAVLLDEKRTTAPNGFLGFWLPRDQELTLTVSLDGAVATAPLSTHPDSATCITTMQLTA
ncbi:CueP family metal-binding protein [Brachybacterium sp. AOP42-E1-35]|uniref:CueP family metal-binding protein n=1 Tax=Brachybacterium sp. AOP42-E1-35 TaxID=3457664 RepID=UPI00402A5FFD